MDWARILAYVTGTADQELLARNEYLATKSGILKHQLKGRPMLSNAERRRAKFQPPVTHGLRHNPPVQLRSMSCA